MFSLKLFQTELQWLIRCVFLRRRCRLLGSRLRWDFVISLWELGGVVVLLGLLCYHGLRVETKPLDGFESRRMDAHILHLGDKVQNVTAMFALAETVPNAFADAHPELRRVAAFVDWTRAGEAVSASFEPVEQTIVLQHPLHGYGRFDGLEVNKR